MHTYPIQQAQIIQHDREEIKEGLRQHRTRRDRYKALTKEEWLAVFAEQFQKHLCPEMNGRLYNRLRDTGTPAWETVARYTGDITWTKLMNSAGVRYPGTRGLKTAHRLTIGDVHSPLLKKLDRMNAERRALDDASAGILKNRSFSTERKKTV